MKAHLMLFLIEPQNLKKSLFRKRYDQIIDFRKFFPSSDTSEVNFFRECQKFKMVITYDF